MSKSRDRRRRADRRQRLSDHAWPPVPEGYIEWLHGLRRPLWMEQRLEQATTHGAVAGGGTREV